MDNNSHKDFFDELGDKFRSPDHAKAEWNTPPDFVFDEAMIEIKRNRKSLNKKNSLFLILIFLCVCVSIGSIYFTHKINSLESKVGELSTAETHNLNPNQQTSRSILDSTFDNKSNSKQQPNKAQTDESKRTEDKNNSIQKIITPSSSKRDNPAPNLKPNNQPTQRYTGSPIKDQNSIYGNLSKLNKKITSSNKPLNNTNQQTTLKTNGVELISTLPLIKQNFLSGNRPSQLPNMPQMTLLLHPNMTTKYIELGTILNVSSFAMADWQSNSSTMTKYNQYYRGQGVYGSFQHAISKQFFGQATISFQRINNESRLVGQIDYDQQNIIVDDTGLMMYDMDMQLETPIGPVSSRERLAMTHNVENPSYFKYDTNTRQELNILSAQIGAGAYMYRNSKLSIYSLGQVGYNYVAGIGGKASTNMNIDESTSAMAFDTDMNTPVHSCKHYISASFQAGASYDLTQKFSLNMGLGYLQSLSSLRNDNTSTILKSLQFNFGATRSL